MRAEALGGVKVFVLLVLVLVVLLLDKTMASTCKRSSTHTSRPPKTSLAPNCNRYSRPKTKDHRSLTLAPHGHQPCGQRLRAESMHALKLAAQRQQYQSRPQGNYNQTKLKDATSVAIHAQTRVIEFGHESVIVAERTPL